MPVISLLTDFGTDDEYVGLVKAVIYGIAPEAAIVDLCHRIDPHDIGAAALLLANAWPYFPEGSVHLAVVDPGVGSDREILAASVRGHTFVAPDNGLLTRVLDGADSARVVRVQNSDYFLAEVSRTFHGRDVFAPVGAHLFRGLALERLGPPADPNRLCRLDLTAPGAGAEGELVGSVVWVDRFGNLITDIDSAALMRLSPTGWKRRLTIEIRGRQLAGVSRSYTQVPPGAMLALIGSRGTLEIAANQGNASTLLDCGRGEPVRVKRENSG